MKRRDVAEVIIEIRSEIPGFNKEELLNYTRCAIPKLYSSLKNEEELEVKCAPELITKLNKEKVKYRISNNMDNISIQYVELFDNIKKDNEMYIQVYLSIYFYDNVQNNFDNGYISDKYWNDIWIVTYRQSDRNGMKNANCINCGAIMEYNEVIDRFECEYCGNKSYNNLKSKWEIVDIELGN